jgi:hypothetical protein
MAEEKIQTQQSFEERMMVRIKEAIGDMITDDELKTIVAKGIDKAFFAQTVIADDYGRKKFSEPLALKAVQEFARKKVDMVVEEWLKNNPEEMLNLVENVIKEGMAKLLIDAFNDKMNNALYQFKHEIQQMVSRYNG